MDTQKKPVDESEKNILTTVFYLIGIIFHYRLMIFIVTIMAMILVLSFCIITLYLPPEQNPMPNVYRASAVIRLQSSNSGLSMESLLSSLGVRNNPGMSSDITSVVQHVIVSGVFLDGLINEFGIMEMFQFSDSEKSRARQFILLSSSDNIDPRNGLMYLTFDSTDPVFASKFVNRKIELLQEWFLKEGGSARSRQMELLENRMLEAREEINELEAEVKNFQNKYGVLSVEALSSQLESILSDLQRQLVQTDMEINQYTRYSRIEDPSLARLRAERQNILSMIDQIDKGYMINGKTMPSREELSDLSVQFTRLSMNLQIQTDIYQALAQRFEILRLAAIEENVFTVLEWAEVPEMKIAPYRGQLSIKVTLIAFFGSIAMALGFHFLRKFFTDPDKVRLLQYLKGK